MSVEFARAATRCWPRLVLLALGLGCSRTGADSCVEGQECGALGESELPGALVTMPAGALPPSGCGDGVLDPEREECDDGSACRDGRDCTEEAERCQVGSGDRSCAPRSADGCSAECRVEPGYSCPEVGACQRLATGPASEASADLPLEPDPAPSASTGGGAIGAAGAPPVAPVPPASTPPCDGVSFEEAERVQGLGLGAAQLWAPALSSDGSTLYFAAASPGVPERIYAATRSQRGRRFSAARLVAGVDSGAGDGTPLPSHDGLRLYFYSRRSGGSGDRDLWLATRGNPRADFASPTLLPGVNSPALEHLPWLSADELTLLLVSTRAGGLGQSDLWLARRNTAQEAFAQPTLLRAASSSADEGRAVLSASGRTLIFASDRAGGQGLHDLWQATRAEGTDQFAEPSNLGQLNGPATELDPFLSLDERELFFVSDRDGTSELWRARRDCEN